MKYAFRLLWYFLSFPVVILAILFDLLIIRNKAKKIIKYNNHLPTNERQKILYKLFKKIIYCKRVKIIDRGFDLLPRKQIFYISNHKSFLDPIVTYIVLYEKRKLNQLAIVAKAELSKKWYFKKLSVLANIIFIQRDDGRSILQAYYSQTEYVQNGFSILIYPEGTRVKGDNFLEFKSTTLRVAFENLIAISPLVIYGCDLENHKLKKGEFYYRIYISALPLIQPNDYITTKHQLLMPIIQQKIYNEYLKLKKNK